MNYRSIILLLVIFLAPYGIHAQTGTREHRFHCVQPPDALLLKQVHQVIADLDPNGSLSTHLGLMKARMNNAVSHGELIDALNALGTTQFISGWPALTVERTASSALTFPVFEDTGHPAQDSIAFALAKQAWANANPHLLPLSAPDQ